MSDARFQRLSRPFSLLAAVIATTFFSPQPRAQQRTPFQQGWDLGSPITVTGELMVLVADDFQNQRSELIHTIRDERTGKEFRLRFEFDATSPHVRSGSRVTVRGRAADREIYLAAADGSITEEAPHSSSALAGVPAGDQSTLVIVTHFQDKQVNPMLAGADCSIQAISDRMFTHPQDLSVDDMYRAASFGQVSFSGSVAGPYTIAVSSTDACDTKKWADLADSAAAAAGYDPSAYPRKVYVMPSNSCPAAGIGQVGVTPSRAWVFTCDRPRVYAHELGHNLGMDHAADPDSEYGDGSDVMGLADGLASFNAPHRIQMTWLPDAQAQVVTQDGVYQIAPLAQSPDAASGPQALTISVPGSTSPYYLSYRRGGGFESYACCSYLDRTSLHRWAGGSARTNLVATLADGAAFMDPATGLTVTQLSHSDTSATVQIAIGNACAPSAPRLTMTPSDQSGVPGATRTYDLSLTNNDSPACPVSSFALGGAVPAGWTGSWSVTTLQVAPGFTASARWSVTPPTSAQSGAYFLTASARDAASAAHAASTTAAYAVTAGDTLPPTVPGTPAAKVKGKQVLLSWEPSADDVAVATYRVWRDGLPVASITATGWTDSAVAPASSYTYFVTAHDAAGNSSAPSGSVLVRTSGGGKGK